MRELAHAVSEDEGSHRRRAAEHAGYDRQRACARSVGLRAERHRRRPGPEPHEALPRFARADGKVEPAPMSAPPATARSTRAARLATLKALIADTTHREDASLPPAMLWAGLRRKAEPKETGLAPSARARSTSAYRTRSRARSRSHAYEVRRRRGVDEVTALQLLPRLRCRFCTERELGGGHRRLGPRSDGGPRRPADARPRARHPPRRVRRRSAAEGAHDPESAPVVRPA